MDGLFVQAACTQKAYPAFCLSFVNSRQTFYHGSHVDAFWAAMEAAAREAGWYWKRIKEQVSCVVVIQIEHPHYAGSTKEKLDNPEIVLALSKMFQKRLLPFAQQARRRGGL